MAKREFPVVCPHGEIRQLFDDVFFVTGSVSASFGPLPFTFSRNMTVVRDGESLTLINTMRLDEAGLAALDALGKVEHVLRIAGFHGMDDPFYKDRYDAKVWAVEGQLYTTGFDIDKTPADAYFEPDVYMTDETELPIRGARLFQFKSPKVGEGLVVLERAGGIVVAGDSLQNWNRVDPYFGFVAGAMMKVMGFIKAHNLGPGWIKMAQPATDEVRGILDLEFDHVLPVHGAEVIGDAREKYRPAIERLG